MKRDTQTIDRFSKRGITQRRIVFQLVLDEDGRYEIKREGVTIILFSKEQQARISFELLKGGDTKKIR
jgi:hypothetical protein